MRWICLGLVLVLAAPGHAAEWRIDPARSSLTVAIDQGGRIVDARFERFSGEIRFDPEDLAGSAVTIAVDLASFRSGDGQRDQIATSAEFLGASDAPQATYRATSFAAEGGDRYRVAAELTLKGVTGAVTHPAMIEVAGDAARARGEIVLDRLAYGVGASQFPRGDQVGLSVTVRFDLAATRAG